MSSILNHFVGNDAGSKYGLACLCHTRIIRFKLLNLLGNFEVSWSSQIFLITRDKFSLKTTHSHFHLKSTWLAKKPVFRAKVRVLCIIFKFFLVLLIMFRHVRIKWTVIKCITVISLICCFNLFQSVSVSEAFTEGMCNITLFSLLTLLVRYCIFWNDFSLIWNFLCM